MARTLLSYAEAAEAIRLYVQHVSPSGTTRGAESGAQPEGVAPGKIAAVESVPLFRAAGRVLARQVRADRDQPPFPRSTRDGYACRAEDANRHEPLRPTGLVRAGEVVAGRLAPGEVWEIMTGAPVPEGADAVFMIEHADREGEFVLLLDPRTLAAGENIVPAGAEARAGDLLLPPGVRLGPAQIALAAQCGYAQLSVVPKPVVAILSTGDELVTVEESPGISQIRNSNSPMLAALVAAAGGDPIVAPAVPDEKAAIDAALATALRHHPDMLLLTGGISAGRFDLVLAGLERAGARVQFAGVAMQPGKPVVFGQIPLSESEGRPPERSPSVRDDRLIPFFALPGNPISSAATFHLFATPVLAALGGDSAPKPRFALAKFAGEWRGKPGLTRFLPGWCDFSITPAVELIPWHGSGDLAAFGRSNCLVVLPSGCAELHPGSPVSIVLTE